MTRTGWWARWAVLGLVPLLGGAQCTQSLQDVAAAFPAFTSAPTGPTDTVSDADFKQTTISVDLKNWVGATPADRTRIYVDYSTAALAPGTIVSTEVCMAGGPQRDCQFAFPNLIENGEVVFPVGTTVTYQWSIDYRLPEGQDVATVVNEPRAFETGPTTPCGGGNASFCAADEVCVVNPVGDPEVALSTRVCRVPGP